jgi:DNA repair exonuclease SbcCD ATPase subunit
MFKKIISSLLLITFCSLIQAQSIKDVHRSSGAYNAIKKSVKKGYLPLYSDKTFRPENTITRKEIAIMIDKLIAEVKTQKIPLTKAQIQELETLSQTFKDDLITIHSKLSTLETQSTHFGNEDKQLHHDLTQVTSELKGEIAQLKQERTYLWAGIGGAAILGLLVK